MRNGHMSNSWTDPDGNDIGGTAVGMGFTISWQNGPLGIGVERKSPNGAFVEDVIDACFRRLEVYQNGNYPCNENELAIEALQKALEHLDARTKDREARGVEGKNEV